MVPPFPLTLSSVPVVPNDRIDRTTARKMWRTLEPYPGMIYFVPEAVEHVVGDRRVVPAHRPIPPKRRNHHWGSRACAWK